MQPTNKVIRGRYRIVRQLGQSETSTVYKAFDTNRETNIALKEIHIDLDAVPSATEREILKRDFANQAKILAKVKHESLPQLRGYFSEFDRHYLVMELVDGEDAGELLAKTKKPIELSEAINWADQLLDTLDYLHTLPEPIVHGDVNPQNVRLTSRGKIKLLGFRIAAENLLPKMSGEAAALRYLSPGQVLRAVNEAARKNLADKHADKLEKILSRAVDARGDVYALGATLYHLMTAQPPLGALERLSDVWSGKPDPLSAPDKINKQIPPEISAVLVKSLEIEREKRFASATEMRHALQTAVERAKQREAETARQEAEAAKKKEEAAALELRQAEQKRLDEERQKIEKERLEFETEQKRQSELIAKQLEAAEAERLKAEQRAAEAEQLLLEKEAKKAAEEKAANQKKAEDEANKSFGDEQKFGRRKTDAPATKSLFVEEKAKEKSSWMMPAIIVAVLAMVSVGGFVFTRSSKTAESKPPVAAQTNTTAAPVETKADNNTQPIAETVPETTAPPENATADAPAVEKTAAPQTSFKNRPIAPQQQPAPRVVKPNALPAKAPANQKKAVTVDDIISN